jgi:hypothetical protein
MVAPEKRADGSEKKAVDAKQMAEVSWMTN